MSQTSLAQGWVAKLGWEPSVLSPHHMLPHFQVLSALVVLAVPWVQKEQNKAPPPQLDCLLHPNPFRDHFTLPSHVPSLGPEDMRCAFLVYLSAPLQNPQPGSLCSSKLVLRPPLSHAFYSLQRWLDDTVQWDPTSSFSYLWFNEEPFNYNICCFNYQRNYNEVPRGSCCGSRSWKRILSIRGSARVLGTVTAMEHDPSQRALHLHFN